MEINAISMRVCGELAKENMEAMSELMQSYSEQMQDLSHAKGLDDVARLQARWASKTAPQFYQRAQRMLETMMEGATEYQKCFEKNTNKVTSKVKDEFKKTQEKFTE